MISTRFSSAPGSTIHSTITSDSHTNKVGDLMIMQKTRTSVWGSKLNSTAASERRLMVVHRIIVAFLFIIILLTGTPSLQARKIKTRHSIPKTKEKSSQTNNSESSDSIISLASDSITFTEKISPAIRFYGFDKTATSSIESFFISNGLEDTLACVEVEITYFDMKGRQLHKRSVSIDCDLPHGETRRYDVKGWDTQKSFYFHQSVKPKRQATPFDVRLELLSVTL